MIIWDPVLHTLEIHTKLYKKGNKSPNQKFYSCDGFKNQSWDRYRKIDSRYRYRYFHKIGYRYRYRYFHENW